MREAASNALVSMADADLIGTLQRTYLSVGERHRTMIAELLGTIGLPESEDALLQLLPLGDLTPKDRAWIAYGLLQLFTTQGFDALRQVAIEGDYDDSLLNLQTELPWLAEAIGKDLPEADEWDRQRETRLRRYAASLDEDSPDLPSRPLPATKVGRNEPCPCGSGKKYKKCCGQ